MLKSIEVLVLPIFVTLIREVEGSARAFAQFTCAGNIVCVNMRFGHRNQAHVLLFDFLQIYFDIAPGIDNQGLTRSLAANHIGGMG